MNKNGLLFLGLMVIVSAFIFTLISSVLGGLIYDVNIKAVDISLISKEDNVINYLKFVQFFSALGVFVVPALVYAQLDTGIKSIWGLKGKIDFPSAIIGGVVMIIALPLLSYVAEWNQNMSLPEFMGSIEKWMKEMEHQNNAITALFLNAENINGLMTNLLIVAILPAIGEELLFRGCIQSILSKSFKNSHGAVLITAFIFSAFHFQFFTFMPRFLMGIFLGYLFVWGKSIWYPMIAHFVNNALAVVMTYLYHQNMSQINPDKMGSESISILVLIFTVVVLSFVIYFLKKRLTLLYRIEQKC